MKDKHVEDAAKEIASRTTLGYDRAKNLAERMDSKGLLRNPGTPIEPSQVRKGDRVRIVYEDGYVVEETRSFDRMPPFAGRKVFLLDRPGPAWPTEVGTVVVARDPFGIPCTLTLDKSNTWRRGADAFTTELTDREFELLEVIV